MKITKWNESSIELNPSNKNIQIVERPTGFVKGFNEGKGIDSFISLPAKLPYIDFNYDSHRAVAYHQPELNDGHSFQPIHVINSVAFYHPFKSNNEYGAGKIGHLYRLKIKELNGSMETWCDWTKEKAGILRLWIDKAFLAISQPPYIIYPVGDTFGYTTLGATQDSLNGGSYVNAIIATAVAGTATTISVGGGYNSATENMQMAIYLVSTLALKGSTPSVTVSMKYDAPGWTTGTISSPPVLTAATHYLCFNTDGWFRCAKDTVTVDTFSNARTFGAWDATLATPTQFAYTQKWSIYANVTPASTPSISNISSRKLVAGGLL